MRRVLLLALALLTTAVLAAGCGDDDETVSTGDPAADDGAATDDDATDGDGDGDEPIGGGPYPIADLNITYEHPEEGVSFTYRITCLGDTATITGDVELDESTACLALAEPEVQTRLIEGPPADQVCTEQYGGPDVAVITGTLDEQPVDTTVDRTNGCGISTWDDLLGAVLPNPIGVTG
ncbi:MAG: hypothetical protein ACE367_14925 [Acidimicrobiales bacterium]